MSEKIPEQDTPQKFNHLISEGSYVSTYNILRKATWTATNDRLYWEEG